MLIAFLNSISRNNFVTQHFEERKNSNSNSLHSTKPSDSALHSNPSSSVLPPVMG